MRIREPVVAGQFYPAQRERCQEALSQLLAQAESKEATGQSLSPPLLAPPSPPARKGSDGTDVTLLGGLAPHAGWTYSGRVAARVFARLAASRKPEVIILFGGVHRYRGREAAMFGSGRWETPLGPLPINERLAERILGHTNAVVDDPYAHEEEHSLEVQAPFIRHLFPDASIVPIMVPPVTTAHQVGDAVGRTLTVYRYDAVIVGTTDLTHYGPRYGFTPKGVGPQANAWAKEENDRRFIDLVLELKEADVVTEARERKNACSGGAVAATIAACKALGATYAALLEHGTSGEVTMALHGENAEESVGYAGILFAKEETSKRRNVKTSK